MKLFKRIAKVATKSKKDNTDVVAPLAKPASEQDTKVIAKPLPSGVVASAVVQDEETRQDPSVQQAQAKKLRAKTEKQVLDQPVSELDEETLRNELKQLQGVKS
ncbi:hypothetical protein GUITHDRAFT_108145 [Guillardia theta CCMP2712]|uniref:Uncharacterized protein n=1 Tax=Guillardia theta (strain CCMP2712) TaxID=905079 RepID=L1JC62_GUITC|nr:hypothetical protein GUITHDRAFT_108145 [Guillardia theta CCMP2712]EKX46111.1 hypothetical protein GUITHDRAFT_108145 [Guillardia theta CCMP2712]|eukprot:XP_005833091.1 hypothetical protein GUITHDRAFT_108145 [Guillardia theta CCMP2712]